MVSSQNRLRSLGNIFTLCCPREKHGVLASCSATSSGHTASSAPKTAHLGDSIVQGKCLSKVHQLKRKDQRSNGHHPLIAMDVYGVTGIMRCMWHMASHQLTSLSAVTPASFPTTDQRIRPQYSSSKPAASTQGTDRGEKQLQSRLKRLFHAWGTIQKKQGKASIFRTHVLINDGG